MVAMQALRRDVLQWLVSLNLPFPIKNIKRDFSNGFLVAEILSRYFPQDVQMHSFDYGTKMAKKKDNWDQLKKIFWKEDFPFFQDEIENIINCGPQDGAGPFLERLYGFLTHRRYKPDDLEGEELWRGIPDSNTFFANELQSPRKEDCKLVKNNENQDISLIDESMEKNFFPAVDSAKMTAREQEDEQSILLEMDLDKEEFEPNSNGLLWVSREVQQMDNTLALTIAEKTRRASANAVERARQKDRRSRRTHDSVHAKPLTEAQDVSCNLKSRDVNLAFRSPNRQREYKSYTLKDYRKHQMGIYVELGRLGPDINTESLLNQRVKLEKMKAFGRNARDINISQTTESRKPKEKLPSCREKAIEFASKIPKPKKKALQKENLKDQVEPSSRPLTELEKMEAKHQKDRQHIEAIRRDLECFLR